MQQSTQPKSIFSIKLGAKDLTNTFASKLESLTLTENRGPDVDQLDIVLTDDGSLDIPHRGIELTIAIGWLATGLVPKGSFIVDEVEHTGIPDKLTIRARSADMREGLTTQKERSWHAITLDSIIKVIASENNLQHKIADNLKYEVIDHIDQTNESDMNLLSRLAKLFDAVFTVKNGSILFMQTAAALSATGKPLASITIARSTGDQHRFAVADRDAVTAVKALYHDVKRAIKGEVLVDDILEPAITKKDTVIVTPVGRIYTVKKDYKSKGAALRAARNKYWDLQEAKQRYGTVKAHYRDIYTGKEIEVIITADNINVNKGNDAIATDINEPATALTASGDDVKTLRHVYSNKKSATRGARAELKRIKRGVSQFSLTLALGRPDVFPELPATVQGFKPAIDSTSWLTTKATHVLDAGGGLVSRLAFELQLKEVS